MALISRDIWDTRAERYNMVNFETLISNAMNTPESEVFFNGIQVVNGGTKEEYYIDLRTWENPKGLKIVLPVCFYNSHYWYICPDCGQLHSTEFLGKQQTGCCEDIDCERLQKIGGEWVYIQRTPIIVDAEPLEP